MNKKFYITTTIPYVNAAPHIGFALERVQADAIARYHKLLGEEVIFNSGADEHGVKIYRKALEEGKDPQAYCDEYAAKFGALESALNTSSTNFIRTTAPQHIKAAQEFWKLCDKNGFIEKGLYKSKYCVGCELEKTDSDLVDGKCPFHPNLEIETYEEENYFFKFSEFEKPLLEFYDKNPNFVIPDYRFNEIKTFVKNGLQDFSISRLKAKMPWGVPVPGDDKHVMYVWFDALVCYLSTLGWPDNQENYNNYWPVVQTAGKDNLRQQTAIWQAMLLAAGLPNSKQIYIHGFINVGGQKISKSAGNAINPLELTEKYGTDALRYYLLAKINPYDDSDFTIEKFEEAYNADLANNLGNLVSRVVALTQKFFDGKVPAIDQIADEHPLRIDDDIYNWKKSWADVDKFIAIYRFDSALESVWKFVDAANKYIDQNKPWQFSKGDPQLNWIIYGLLDGLHQIAWQILPFLPETAKKIAAAVGEAEIFEEGTTFKASWTNVKEGNTVSLSAALFPRISK